MSTDEKISIIQCVLNYGSNVSMTCVMESRQIEREMEDVWDKFECLFNSVFLVDRDKARFKLWFWTYENGQMCTYKGWETFDWNL